MGWSTSPCITRVRASAWDENNWANVSFIDPTNTAATIDEDGWLHTGDIAELDSCGRFMIIDRIKVLAYSTRNNSWLILVCRTS